MFLRNGCHFGGQRVTFPVEGHGLISGDDKGLIAISEDAVEANAECSDFRLIGVAVRDAFQSSPICIREGYPIIRNYKSFQSMMLNDMLKQY